MSPEITLKELVKHPAKERDGFSGAKLKFFTLSWLPRHAVNAGVEIKIRTEFSKQVVEERTPEVISLCSGSKQPFLDIPGVDLRMLLMLQRRSMGTRQLGIKSS